KKTRKSTAEASNSRPRKRRKLNGQAPSTKSAPISMRESTATRLTDGPSTPSVVDASASSTTDPTLILLRNIITGSLTYTPSQSEPGKYLAIDCEMVGIGLEGSESSLARVSLVNYHGAIILDVFVRQRERVVDYRTQWSGIREKDMVGAKPFEEVQKQVAELIKDRILIGHAVHNDLKERVTDARATMAVYRLHKKEWEKGSSNGPGHAGSSSLKHKRDSSVSSSKKGKGKERDVSADGDSSADENSSDDDDAGSPIAPTPKLKSPSHPKSKSESKSPGEKQRKGISSGLSMVIKRRNGANDASVDRTILSRDHSRTVSTSKSSSAGGGGKKAWWAELPGSSSSGRSKRAKGSLQLQIS
ncbi:RNA exonuclease 4, partial [Leucoagaricus sp. SymC.cos]